MPFADDAGLFPHQLDIAGDRVLLVRLTQQDYRDASFLDQRLLGQERQMQWADWNVLEAETAGARDDAQFIFHVGHVGSTLISRLLGELPAIFALREPQLLRSFAELGALRNKPESPWPPERVESRLESLVRWLSRTFSDDQRALVKVTSFANELAGPILSSARKAIFLYARPETYIRTILAGENSRQELAVLAGTRLARLHARIEATPWRLWQLAEAERAAMSWTSEMAALESAAGANVLWMDFDDFLAEPARGLVKLADCLGHSLPTQAADKLAESTIMQSYSKAPEHDYSADLRRQLLEQTGRERAADIAAAMKWLDKAAASFDPVGQTLERVGS